jgi:uncharacterized protein YfaS (alpha-2-macroglobulin family)
MTDSRRFRPAPVTALALAAVALALPGLNGRAFVASAAPTQASASPAPPAVAQKDGWTEVERLIGEQKMEEALKIVEGLRAAARAAGGDDEWAKALIAEVQIRSALHGYETSVRFLREEPWPKSERARAALHLFYGRALIVYLQAYSWEIEKRERIDTKGVVDLKAWTKDEIATEATRAYAEVWQGRAALGAEPVSALSEFLAPNNYPPRIRGTLRDAVSYLFVEMLADTSLWRPDHSAEVYRLDLFALLRGAAAGPTPVKLDDSTGHPLLRMAAILDDLESWHAGAGRREAALEARLERLRRLYASFSEPEDRGRIRADLESRLPALRGLEWWSMGQAERADMVRQEDAPDSLVRAHGIAEEGLGAYPGSLGAERCLAIAKSIEAPDYELASMATDGLERRSIEVTHRNLAKLHFRAYALDLIKSVESARDYSLLPGYEEMRSMVKRTPDHAWTVDLPPTPDYRSHRTFVTPSLARPGLYAIAVSAQADFSESDNRVLSLVLVVGDLVLVTRPHQGGYEATCLSGSTGEAAPGTEVSLYRFDWQKGHERVATATAGADGVVVFPHLGGRQGSGHFLVARRGPQVAVDGNWLFFHAEATSAATLSTLIYSDRSVYRPGQTIRFKVVAYRGDGETSRFRTYAEAALTLDLLDANNQAVESKSVTTNAFGSAAGEFVVPPGRALGQWWLRSSLGGQSAVRVEEYKRPTFEVKLLDVKEAMRLNREATLEGEARYYFGLPVTGGQVRWRVTREPVYPWWWELWHGRADGGGSGPRTLAAGSAALDEAGRFRVVFTPEADERLAKAKEVSFRYKLSADVTDEGGETRSAARSFRLGFVAVEASLTADVAFFREGEPAVLTVRRTNLDGVARPGPGSWRVVALRQPEAVPLPADQPLPKPEDPTAHRTPGDALRARHDAHYSPEAVLRAWADGDERARGSLDHDAQGEARLTLQSLPPGAYRIRYETIDDFGASYSTAMELLVAGGTAPIALPLVVKAEQSSVKVGATARFLVHSGLRGLPMTLDVERAGRRVERRALVAGDGPVVLDLPVREADRGGFGVTVTAVRDHQLMTFSEHVFVPWDDRELKLDFATFRDTLRPGARETWRVSVRRPGGGPAEAGAAELLAYMYDRSLDVFAPHSPPSPLSLYPTRSGTAWVRANLGQAPQEFLWDNGFASVPSGPALFGDRLTYFDGYGLGGLGRRGGEGLFADAVVTAAPPPPQASRAERRVVAGALAVSSSAVAFEMDEGAPSARAEAQPDEPAPLRRDFSETAFWQPHLLTGSDGSASIEFTVPDSVTSWNVWVHAVTRDLRGASLKKEARTVKELMVRPYLPRFLREADEAALKVVVNNAGDKPLSGQVTLEILDPETNQSLIPDFGLASAGPRPFTVAPGGAADVTFPLKAPRGVRTVAFKVVATAGDLSDGELRALPLLPGRVHLAQSRFAALKGKDRRTLRFPDLERNDDPTRVNEKVVVTLDAQLFYGVLQALPYLVSYPYECTEQTLNRFLSTGILMSVFDRYPAVARLARDMAQRETRLETWDLADPNRKMALEETPWLEEATGGADAGAPLLRVLDPRIARAEREGAMAKLRKAQTSLGGFPWWPGGPPSPYMTLYIVYGFSKALEFGADVPKDVTVKAWAYLHRHYIDEIVREAMARDCCPELVTFMNFVLSSYPDLSWSGGVFTDAERTAMLDFSFRHWKEHSPYTKAYLALTLHRMGRSREGALVFDSVMDSAKTDPDLGTYWAPEDRAWLWYNDTIETHAFALRALTELRPKDPRRESLVQWLFLNKKLNHWKSTRATAEVIYSLFHYLKAEGALGAREDARVSVGGRTFDFDFAPDAYTGKANHVVLEGREIDPKTAATAVVEKQSPGMVFASATWHFSTETLPAEERGDLLGVSRRYFRRENRGGEWVLAPLAEEATLAPGDEVEIQLSIRAKHAAEYVHLRDPRAAGLEPGIAVSRYKWELGLAWYEEVRDSGTNFFFEWLPAGEYTLKYRVRAAMAGRFRVGPATLRSMYAPEFTAYSAGARLEVR